MLYKLIIKLMGTNTLWDIILLDIQHKNSQFLSDLILIAIFFTHDQKPNFIIRHIKIWYLVKFNIKI